MLGQAEFEKLFNERTHNPPAPDADFDDEFDSAISMLQPILLIHALPKEFLLWDKHNRARFIDVAFESQAYLQPALVAAIQQWLRTLKEDWMVCLWMTSWLFITKNKVLCFAQFPNDPEFQEFLRNMSDA